MLPRTSSQRQDWCKPGRKQSACATHRKRTRGSCLLRRPATGDGEVYHEGYSSVSTKQFQAYMPTLYCTFCCLGHCDFFEVHHCPVPWSWASPRCYDPSCVALVVSSILDVDAYVHTMPKRVVCKVRRQPAALRLMMSLAHVPEP